MSVNLYKPNALITSAFTLTQMSQEPDPDFGIDDLTETASGAVYPGFTGSAATEPGLDFSTPQIASVLEDVTIEGVGVVLTGNTDLEWQRAENLKARLSPSEITHTRMRATSSLFYWKSISVDAKGNAQLMARWKPISDGTNPPWVFAKAALTGTPLVTELFGSGPVVLSYLIGAVQHDVTLCNDGWTWENNVVERNKICGGLTFETFASIDTVSPIITVPIEDVDEALYLLPQGRNLVSVSCYLRRRSQGGANVAAATAQHIKLSATVGSVKPAGTKSIKIAVHGFAIDVASVVPSATPSHVTVP